MNNRRAVTNYLADMRADCKTAAGAAVIAGLPEVGKVLAWISSAPLDKLRGMRYTDIIKQPAQRAENQEGNTMKKYAVYTHYDSNKTVIGYIVPLFDNGTAFITQRTYNALLKKRTVGGTAGIYSDYPGEIRISNDEKTEYVGYMQ